MPTILKKGPYHFYFLAGDGGEPPHVHVRRDRQFAKFWLEPVVLQRAGSFDRTEIRRIQRIVQQHQTAFLEAWYDFFNR